MKKLILTLALLIGFSSCSGVETTEQKESSTGTSQISAIPNDSDFNASLLTPPNFEE